MGPPDVLWVRAAPISPPHLLSRGSNARVVRSSPGFREARSHLQAQSSLCQPARNVEQPKKKKRQEKKKKAFSALRFIGACIFFLFFYFLWFADFTLSAICYLLSQFLLRQRDPEEL